MGPYVPPGQSPPFEVIDEYHRAAYIIITTALGLVISLVCFQIRLYVRLYLIPPFARDDFVLLGATVSSDTVNRMVHYAVAEIISYARYWLYCNLYWFSTPALEDLVHRLLCWTKVG
jgi:hypothetical protein